MILTRWHQDDLAGRMAEAMAKGGDQWRIIRLPALALDDDPLGRQAGKALWPERYGVEYLLATKAVDEDAFETLYQGNPVPFGTALFSRDKFKVIARAPQEVTAWYRGWDLAFKTAQKNDFTASARVAMGPKGELYISRAIRYKREWPDSREVIIATGRSEPDTAVGVESVAAQVMAWQELKRDPRLAGRRIVEVNVDSDKRARAMVWSWREIYLVAENDDLQAEWIPGFLNEVCAFPYGAHDDYVDAVSTAVQTIGTGSSGIYL
jgi:predicted phage terminase large subunit-like protein